MPARFKISNTFALRGRSVFVLEGKITRGKIHDGMDLQYTDGKGRISLLPIDAIEYSLHRQNGNSAELIGLCLRFVDEEMLSTFRSLRLKNRSFIVSQPAVRLRFRASYEYSGSSYAHEPTPEYTKANRKTRSKSKKK